MTQKLARGSIDTLLPFDYQHPSSPTSWRRPYAGHTISTIYSPGIPPPQLCYTDCFSSTHSVESSATLSTSTSSSFSEDLLVVTEDPKFKEHRHQFQSQIRIADEQPLIHVPPFYRSPGSHVPVLSLDTSYPTIPNMYGTYGFQQLSPVSPTKTRAQVRSASRHKAVNYRTKPCRYFKASGTCPNGSECTFIHDEPAGGDPLTSPIEKLAPGLPPKPISIAEENKKKNFFPISWRVIGGGVLMGASEPNVNFERDGTSFGGAEQSACGAAARQMFIESSILVSPPSAEKSDRSPPRPITRTRSTSNPPNPTSAHVKVDTVRPGGQNVQLFRLTA
ncbi:hypothetical protein H0H81_011052 [Sphagnurus paluster]|uniref:C3H1-type domain-containing protein n=1 Tax=Sphagnurus paluster TaxID=117069 RepID=A0A9P7FU65_9AGAR|nr:hypothetical protein H0H81_011052 [Sphagnurus paluster]